MKLHIHCPNIALAPTRAHAGDAGLDLRAAKACRVPVGATVVIPTGVRVAVPHGHVGEVHSRSGLAARHSVVVLNGPGIIDAGYRGELQVILHNHGPVPFDVLHGDRIAQFLLRPVDLPELEFVDALPESVDGRGDGGLGSTGVPGGRA